MRRHMRLCESFELLQSESFASRFGCKLEKIKQGPGITGDFLIVSTSSKTKELEKHTGPLLHKKIEFKNDKTSIKYKTFYIEYEQTRDSWFTTKISGHEKAALIDDCLLIITSGSDCYAFIKESYLNLIKYSIRTLCTRNGANGNVRGCKTRGRIVPIKDGRKACSYFYKMTEGHDSCKHLL